MADFNKLKEILGMNKVSEAEFPKDTTYFPNGISHVSENRDITDEDLRNMKQFGGEDSSNKVSEAQFPRDQGKYDISSLKKIPQFAALSTLWGLGDKENAPGDDSAQVTDSPIDMLVGGGVGAAESAIAKRMAAKVAQRGALEALIASGEKKIIPTAESLVPQATTFPAKMSSFAPKSTPDTDITKLIPNELEEGITKDLTHLVKKKPASDLNTKIGYHGTDKTFTEFNPGVNWSTGDPASASAYAASKGSKGARVMPLKVKMKNPLVIKEGDMGRDEAVATARSLGHDGVIIKPSSTGDHEVYATFEPNQLRSIFSKK